MDIYYPALTYISSIERLNPLKGSMQLPSLLIDEGAV